MTIMTILTTKATMATFLVIIAATVSYMSTVVDFGTHVVPHVTVMTIMAGVVFALFVTSLVAICIMMISRLKGKKQVIYGLNGKF